MFNATVVGFSLCLLPFLEIAILPIMLDEESYAVVAKTGTDEALPIDADKPVLAKDLEPFGNEETAEVKYRTMQWW